MGRKRVKLICCARNVVAYFCEDRVAEPSDRFSIGVVVGEDNVRDNVHGQLQYCAANIIVPLPYDAVPSVIRVAAVNSGDEIENIVAVYNCLDTGSLTRCAIEYSTIERKVASVESSEHKDCAPILALALNTSGSLLLTCEVVRAGSLNINVWGDRLSQLRSAEFHPGSSRGTVDSVVGLEFCGQDEEYALACTNSGTCGVWDVLNGTLVCSFETALNGVSGVTLAPSLVTTYYLHTSEKNHPRHNSSVVVSVLAAYADGRVKQYDLLNRDGDCSHLVHREVGGIDLARELRFFKGGALSSEWSAIVRGSVLPLGVLYIPPLWVIADSGDPNGGSPASSGLLCIVTQSAVCVVSTQAWKLVHTVPIDTLGITSPTAASCALSVRDAEHATVRVVLISDLTSQVAAWELPLISQDRVERGAPPVGRQHRGDSLVDVGYDDIDAGLTPGIAIMKVGGGGRSAGASAAGAAAVEDGASVYADPTVPLSLFMHPSMLAARDDSGSNEGRSARRSLLDTAEDSRAVSATTTAKAAPSAVRRVSSASGAWETPKTDKQGKLLDQPITFQKTVKSSGYGQIPQDSFERKRYFQQQERLKKQNAEKQMATKRATLQRSASAPRDGKLGSTDADSAVGEGLIPSDHGPRIRQYPLHCRPAETHLRDCDTIPCPVRSVDASCPIYNIAFAPDGSLMGVASAESSVVTLRLPTNKYPGEVTSYAGHDSRINHVCFTHSRYRHDACGSSIGGAAPTSGRRTSGLLPAQLQPQYQLLSCSADGTARMWRLGSTDGSAITFSHVKHSVGHAVGPSVLAKTGGGAFTSSTKHATSSNKAPSGLVGSTYTGGAAAGRGAAGAASARNRPYGDSVSYASYFYMDKFCTLTVKAAVMLYRYDMHSPDAECDLKRTLAQGSYRLVHQWGLSSQAQSITATACINSTLSPLIFTATSDKYINILDASTGTIARSVESPHTRSVHHIALPRPSVHVPLSPDAYNCFLTAATNNAIRMWDLRAPAAASLFNAHVNRREPVTCEISPCLRYLATGSEDKATVIYDLRAGRVLSRLTGAKDVVRCVAFHPLLPQLAAGSYDGVVRFYADL